ncbi:TetR/AcrR family transcriptional regulator [Devosia sp.]|uniref:TetR/AcrR family transcriptional regulator n=1 Tax=Devosia sp. TaxID=1871048 RepID=UPI003BAC6611
MAIEPTQLTGRGAATRARIVDAAAHLIETQGLANTSLDAVLAESHTSKSQLYHYFADREDLILAVVARKIDMVLNAHQPLLRDMNSLAHLVRWRDELVASSRQVDCAGGCPLGSLVGELGESPRARAAIAQGFSSWEAFLVAGYGRMRTSGQLRPSANPEQLAIATLAALQGGLLLAQVERTVRPLEAALDIAVAGVTALAA